MDLFVLAKEQAKSTTDPGRSRTERNTALVVLGSSKGGKSTLIYTFLERGYEPKPTIALEYTFCRKIKGQNKHIGHIWELGGSEKFLDLLETVITPKRVRGTSMALILDLSKPAEMWKVMEACLAAVRKTVLKAAGTSEQAKLLMKKDVAEKFSSHQDREFIKPLNIPAYIIGTKYDVFQEFEPEKRKMICRSLRFVAHTNGAGLKFVNQKVARGPRSSSVLNDLLFGTPTSTPVCKDPAQPLNIPWGSDSFQDIGFPFSEEKIRSMKVSDPVDLWKAAFCAMFPHQVLLSKPPADPSHDQQYKEERIDFLFETKMQELENLRSRRR